MSIDAQSHRLWQRIPFPPKAAFFSCVVIGYLVHLYVFTNLIPNSDGLSRIFDLQQMTISGRWFLHFASSLNAFTQMPAVIGLLCLVFLGLSAALIVDLLAIRGKVLAALTGGVLVSFPCLGYTFLYMFTAAAYCGSIFMAVASVWLVKRGKLGWLLAVLLLTFAMGTYQAYVTVAIVLSLLLVFRETLLPKATFQDTLRLGLRLMSYLAAGAALYYLVLLLFLKVKNLELLSYLGMDAASAGYPFGQLPALVITSYKQVLSFFFLPGSANGFAHLGLVLLNLVAVLLGLLFFIIIIRRCKGKDQLWRVLGALTILALLPLGMNFMQVLSPYSAPTPLMKYSFVGVYLAVFLLVDLTDILSKSHLRINLGRIAVVWAALLMLCGLNINNLLYTASAQAHRATQSYATRMLGRIEGCAGYESGMEIAVIGAVPTQALRSYIQSYELVDHYSVPLHNVIPLNKHIYYYFNDWLNTPVVQPSDQTMIAIADSAAFKIMPLYPADGSVQILDGHVVVKVQQSYTPKSDYEIAYENRR